MRFLTLLLRNCCWIFIPLIVLIFAVLFKISIGPYWLGPNNDPSYFFLFNFFYLLDGVPLVFTDHPGTPVDIIGALVLKLANFSKVHEELFIAAISRPEFYLHIVSVIMIALYLCSLAFLGWYAYRKFKDPFVAFFVQSSALLLLAVRGEPGDIVLPVIANVNSDTMLLTGVNLFMTALIALFLNTEQAREKNISIALGVICGLGIATKLTFAPLIAVAFVLLSKKRHQLYFLFSFMVSTAVLLIPVYSQSEKFVTWINKLIFYKGVHGAGGHGLVDITTFVLNIKALVISNFFLFIGAVFIFLWAFVCWIKQKEKINAYIVVLCTAIGVQFLIVSKQFAPHYMVPAVGVFGLVMALFYFRFKGCFPKKFWLVFVFIFVAANVVGLFKYQQKLFHKNQLIYAFAQKIQEVYPGYKICSYYRGSSMLYALAWTNYAPTRYVKILDKMYPEFFYYDIWYHEFMDFTRRAVPMSDLLEHSKGVILYGSTVGEGNFLPETKAQRIMTTAQGESLYVVSEHASSRAKFFYELSLQRAKEGEFKDALTYAIYAKKLGLSDDIHQYMELLLREITSPSLKQ